MVMRGCLIVRWWWWRQGYLYFGPEFGRGCQINVNSHLLLLLFLFKLSFWINMHSACHWSQRKLCVSSYGTQTFLRRKSLPVSENCLESRLRLPENKYFRVFSAHYSESPLTFIFCICILSETIMKTFFFQIPSCYWKSYLHKQALLWLREECGVPFLSSLYIFAKACLNRSNDALV